jgi:hypothetical protein
MKKVIKMVISNLVDLYPAKKNLMPALIKEILNLSNQKMRLLRYVFTCVGVQVFHQILAEVIQVEKTLQIFQMGSKPDMDRVDATKRAIEFFVDQNAVVLSKELIWKRAADVQSFVRKAIY